MRTASLSLNSMASGHRVYASATPRSTSRSTSRSSRRYQVLHPLTDNSRTPVRLSRPDRPLFRGPPITPPSPLSPPPKSPSGESNRSALSSSSLSSDISWTAIKDPFQRERGDTHTSDIDSADFSYTSSNLTLYAGSPVEYNGSDYSGSHSSDLVPVLSPCICLKFSPVTFPASSRARSPMSFPPVGPPPPPYPRVSVFSACLARAHLSSASLYLLTRPPPVIPYRPRGRFYNPRFDPTHPLFEPHLLSGPPAASLSIPPAMDKDDILSPIPELDLETSDNNLPVDTNLYSSYPVPGEWPEDSDSLEPTSGPVGWLKALTSPAV
jgi:hypothetical protein